MNSILFIGIYYYVLKKIKFINSTFYSRRSVINRPIIYLFLKESAIKFIVHFKDMLSFAYL